MHLAIALYYVDECDIAVHYLDTIPSDHPLYPKSLLVRAFIYEEYWPLDDKESNMLIQTSQKVTDLEMKSMLLCCAAWNLQMPDQERFDLLLNQLDCMNFILVI